MPFLYPLHTGSRYVLLLILTCVSSVAAEDSGDEFSNNLFSDLAPLLTLFGEQVAKQFLGQSMGWADNLIFSMAPLGIITAVVAAIRVGGPTWLRAIIGRAKESQGVAELELMSSTSASVCELWNGQTVVRVLGSPEIIELVYLEKGPEAQGQNESDAPSVGVYSFEESKSCPSESNPLYRQKRKRRHTSSDRGYSNEYELLGMSSPDMNGSADVEDRIPNPCAPNISLNARGETASQSELWSVAVLGTVIQSFVIVYWGLITKYEPWLSTAKFRKGGRLAPEYAFPMTTVGTVAVVMGMLICSHVVDAATVEEKWNAKEDEEGKVKFAWLQKGQIVNDEHFDSYAIFCLNNKQTIMTSRVKKDLKGFQSLVLLGTIISISGFVAQFMGLRGMHWSATIAQLVATAVMSTLRAIIRRHLTRNPAAKKIIKK
ncbi:hypothetical protein DFP73DRAFT_475768 [Morchella snyderi]|nr:hypothetical protein DFP73DRAFT_475768 [Morchella snyderi]